MTFNSRLPSDRILYEDNHLLVVNKPAELATMGALAGQPTLVELCKGYLRVKYHKPGNVYLGVVSRLDASVAGVIVLARTSKAADRLNQQFRERQVRKEYLALVSGPIDTNPFRWEDWLWKDEAEHRMRVVPAGTPNAILALLTGQVVGRFPGGTRLVISLHSGRKHQIRVQAAHRRSPILGDRKYGSRVAFPSGIGLFSQQVEFRHPISQELLTFAVHPPASWDPWLAKSS